VATGLGAGLLVRSLRSLRSAHLEVLNTRYLRLLQEAADGRFCRWVYGRCSLCLSPRRGDFFRLRHSVVNGRTNDLNRAAP
jgi:hypothetical protein